MKLESKSFRSHDTFRESSCGYEKYLMIIEDADAKVKVNVKKSSGKKRGIVFSFMTLMIGLFSN